MRSLLLIVLFISKISGIELSAQRHIYNAPESIIDLINTSDGTLLCLSASGKIYQFDGADYVLIADECKDCYRMVNDGDQRVILSETGIYKLKDSELSIYPIGEKVYSYLRTSNSEFLLAESGLYSFKEGRFQIDYGWTASIDGSAKFHKFDNDSYLTNGKTIYQKTLKEWKLIARDSFIINDLGYIENKIWAATNHGLRVLQGKSLKQVILDEIDPSQKVDRVYGFQDRLYFQSGNSLSSWDHQNYQVRVEKGRIESELRQDAWGDIWYTESGNLVTLRSRKPTLKPIFSEVVLSADNNVLSGDQILIREGADLNVRYRAYCLSTPRKIKYQSLLSPIESTYGVATDDNLVYYSDLPAGKYTYRLRATIDGDQYAFDDPITIEVEGKDQVSSWWWIMGVAGLGLLGLALLSNYRLQQYKERTTLLTDKLRANNELLRSQQKTMQLQMNPHFLFNALNSIQGLITLNKTDEAKEYLRTFSRMMRNVLEFSKVDKIDLSKEIAYLEDYLAIERMTRSDLFDYEIVISDNLLNDDVKIPPMIMQPFVENAIIHGIASIQDGKITVEVVDLDDILHCTITDNGIGREAAAKNRVSFHKSAAIDIAKERIDKLAKNRRDTGIKYSDLRNTDSKPTGTQVDIRIPI